MLEPLGYTLYSQKEKGISIEVEENGTTFEENAFLKAKAIYDLTGCAALADDSGGFGYDPLFMVGEKSYAEMTGAEKDAVSHRGRAIRLLADYLGK